MSDKYTLSRIQELLERYSNVARHGDIEFHIAQVDSIQYPPDVNHGSIRLNSTIAYLYSDKIRTGHHARNVKELVDNQAAIIRQLLDDHETMRRALEGIVKYDEENTYDGHCGTVGFMAEKALGEVTK